VQSAAADQRPLDAAQKCFIHHAALFVPLLPPWIGEIDVCRRQARVRQPPLKQEKRIAADD
jgi:hypothetical protein